MSWWSLEPIAPQRGHLIMIGGLVVVMRKPRAFLQRPGEVRRARMSRTKPSLWRTMGRGLRTLHAFGA